MPAITPLESSRRPGCLGSEAVVRVVAEDRVIGKRAEQSSGPVHRALEALEEPVAAPE